MSKIKSQEKLQNLYIYLFFLTSLIVSSYFGENSSGGAQLDNIITRQFIDGFLISFTEGINRFINTGQVHSPIFYFLISLLEKYTNHLIVSYIYVLISSLIPIIFYLILKKKFKEADKKKLFLFSLIIYFSPYLRSSASWVTNDNLATLFFALSISKYLSFEKHKKIKEFLICFTYLIIATYIRQYYAIFFLFYLIKLIEIKKFKEIFFIIIYSSLLFMPFLRYYYLFIIQNILNANIEKSSSLPINLNLLNNILIFLSLYFFYTIPLYANQATTKQLKINNNLSFYLMSLVIFLLIAFTNPIISEKYGGGIFYKISEIINFKYLFYLTSFFGYILLSKSFNKNNAIVYLCIIFAFPVEIIYQKYFDPLLMLCILGLTKNDGINKLIDNDKINLKFILLYYFFFLVVSNLYYLK